MNAVIHWTKVGLIGMPGTECGRELLMGGTTRIVESFQQEMGPCDEPGHWLVGMLFLCERHAAKVAEEFGDDLVDIEREMREQLA